MYVIKLLGELILKLKYSWAQSVFYPRDLGARRGKLFKVWRWSQLAKWINDGETNFRRTKHLRSSEIRKTELVGTFSRRLFYPMLLWGGGRRAWVLSMINHFSLSSVLLENFSSPLLIKMYHSGTVLDVKTYLSRRESVCLSRYSMN